MLIPTAEAGDETQWNISVSGSRSESENWGVLLTHGGNRWPGFIQKLHGVCQNQLDLRNDRQDGQDVQGITHRVTPSQRETNGRIYLSKVKTVIFFFSSETETRTALGQTYHLPLERNTESVTAAAEAKCLRRSRAVQSAGHLCYESF